MQKRCDAAQHKFNTPKCNIGFQWLEANCTTIDTIVMTPRHTSKTPNPDAEPLAHQGLD